MTKLMAQPLYLNKSFYHHWIKDQVRFSDLDPLGHVNNNAIGQYFENARASFYQEITPSWPHRDEVLVLARTAIDFVRELHKPADILIGTGLLRLGRTSLTLTNVLFRGDEGIAFGESVSVLINQTTRKPIELTAEIRTRVVKFQIPLIAE